MGEQRTPYKGEKSRAFLRLGFRGGDRSRHTLEFMVDTGSAEGVIVSRALLEALVIQPLPPIAVPTWGLMTCGWVQLYMPDTGLVELVRGYGNDLISSAMADEHPEFQGLIGLPLLRLGEYGGNADAFWFRYPPPKPTATP